jgi:hypothetical protein
MRQRYDFRRVYYDRMHLNLLGLDGRRFYRLSISAIGRGENGAY